MDTFIIVGLGNPGNEYFFTRHNVGFRVLDLLAKDIGVEFRKDKSGVCEKGEGVVDGRKVVLIKPLTFMNLSGKAVLRALQFYKVKPENVLVVCDDLDLPFSSVRFRERGSAGTHNGLKSIVGAIGKDFARVKVGIENRSLEEKRFFDTSRYVLGRFSKDEESKLEEVFGVAVRKVMDFILKR